MNAKPGNDNKRGATGDDKIGECQSKIAIQLTYCFRSLDYWKGKADAEDYPNLEGNRRQWEKSAYDWGQEQKGASEQNSERSDYKP